MLSYVIGDVHGCLAELNQLLVLIRADAQTRQPAATPELVFLGDLIDRGPDSRGVLDLVTSPIDGFETVALAGNHDLMLYSWLFGDQDDSWRRQLTNAYLHLPGNGAPSMLASYGLEGEDYRIHGVPVWAAADIRRDLLAAMPDSVIDYLRHAPDRLWHLVGSRFVAVHAGFDPAFGLEIEHQDEEALTWIRGEFLISDAMFQAAGTPRIVLHGHTPRRDGLPEARSNRVNLDTGCFSTGALTAAVIHDDALAGFLSSKHGIIPAPEGLPYATSPTARTFTSAG